MDRVGEARNVYNILMGKTLRKESFGPREGSGIMSLMREGN